MNWQNKVYESLITEKERATGTKSAKTVKYITGKTTNITRRGHQFSAKPEGDENYNRRTYQALAAAAKNRSFRNPEQHFTIHGDGLRSKSTGEPIPRRR